MKTKPCCPKFWRSHLRKNDMLQLITSAQQHCSPQSFADYEAMKKTLRAIAHREAKLHFHVDHHITLAWEHWCACDECQEELKSKPRPTT